MPGLVLLPTLSKSYWIAQDQIHIDVSPELAKVIRSLEQNRIPSTDVTCYKAIFIEAYSETRNEGYGKIQDDGNGRPLKWTTAGQLCTIRNDPDIQCDFKKRGAWALLDRYPSDWPVVLYWV